jgi:hypothetical protein
MSSSVSHGRSPSGEHIAYHYDLGARGWHIPGRIFDLAKGHVFFFVFRLFGLPWLFVIVVWPLMCAVVLGAETRRAIRMVGVLAASFLPFMAFIPVILVPNTAYMFFWIDVDFMAYVVPIHFVFALWPGLTFARFTPVVEPRRWAARACAGLTYLVTVIWPTVIGGSLFLHDEEMVLSWL